jgi:hypothetical protein
MIKSRRIRWVGHVDENCIHFLLESLKGRDFLEGPGVDEKAILKRILWK